MAAKSDVGVLTVYLEAVSSRFDQGIDKAQKKITGFKGTIGGLGKTWTEMNSKVSLLATGIEFASGAFTGFTKLFKGQKKEFIEYMQGLPVIGGAARRARELRMELDGSADAAKKLANELERIRQAGKDWDKQWETYRKALSAAEAATTPLADRLQILNEQLKNGQASADRLGLEISREDQLRALEAQIEQNNELIKNEEHRERVNAQLEKQLAHLMKIHDLEDKIAQDTAKEEKKRQDNFDWVKSMQKALNEMDALDARSASIRSQGIRGQADSFSSPMGTIRLPSMSTAVDLARKQLSELSAIDAQIQKLRDEVKALAA